MCLLLKQQATATRHPQTRTSQTHDAEASKLWCYEPFKCPCSTVMVPALAVPRLAARYSGNAAMPVLHVNMRGTFASPCRTRRHAIVFGAPATAALLYYLHNKLLAVVRSALPFCRSAVSGTSIPPFIQCALAHHQNSPEQRRCHFCMPMYTARG